LNPRPHDAQLEDKKARKAQECHLEEEKPQKLTKGMKTTKS
jgi:hypothetical protein